MKPVTPAFVRMSTLAFSAAWSIRPCSAAPAVTQCLPVSLASAPRRATFSTIALPFHDCLKVGSRKDSSSFAGSGRKFGRSFFATDRAR